MGNWDWSVLILFLNFMSLTSLFFHCRECLISIILCLYSYTGKPPSARQRRRNNDSVSRPMNADAANSSHCSLVDDTSADSTSLAASKHSSSLADGRSTSTSSNTASTQSSSTCVKWVNDHVLSVSLTCSMQSMLQWQTVCVGLLVSLSVTVKWWTVTGQMFTVILMPTATYCQ